MKRRVIIDVDSDVLFDRLASLKGDTSGIGSRLVGAFLTGDVGLVDAIGLGVYGIQISATEALRTSQALAASSADGGEHGA